MGGNRVDGDRASRASVERAGVCRGGASRGRLGVIAMRSGAGVVVAGICVGSAGAGWMGALPQPAGASAGQPAAGQPAQPVPTIQEAQALFTAQRYKEAADAFAKIVEAQPDNAGAWFQLGYCLHVTGELERAIPAHTRAAELAPKGQQQHFLALYNLGCAHALRGEPDEAFAALMRAVEGGFHTPANLQHITQDADLDALRGDARFAEFVDAMRFKGRSEALRRFDFWIGSWDVYNEGGTLVGRNRIEPIEGGLILMEHWTNARGLGGSSMNYYEPVSRVWKQVWIDSQGVLETSGTWQDGAMRFRGERKLRNGQTRQHRMTFTPADDGRVRQFIEESDDGEAWTVYFDGIYVPSGQAFAEGS